MNLLRRLRGDMETSRLILRHWRESDFEDFLTFAADPQVMLASGATPAGDLAEAQSSFRRAFGRCDGQVFDDVCYSILREEYFAHPERYLRTQP